MGYEKYIYQTYGETEDSIRLIMDMGYTREKFAEKLDVSVSYLAELERGRTGISVKMLIKVCNVLGLSSDYVLFGNERTEDELRLDAIRRIDEKYLPLLDKVIEELLSLDSDRK